MLLPVVGSVLGELGPESPPFPFADFFFSYPLLSSSTVFTGLSKAPSLPYFTASFSPRSQRTSEDAEGPGSILFDCLLLMRTEVPG